MFYSKRIQFTVWHYLLLSGLSSFPYIWESCYSYKMLFVTVHGLGLFVFALNWDLEDKDLHSCRALVTRPWVCSKPWVPVNEWTTEGRHRLGLNQCCRESTFLTGLRVCSMCIFWCKFLGSYLCPCYTFVLNCSANSVIDHRLINTSCELREFNPLSLNINVRFGGTLNMVLVMNFVLVVLL